MGLLLERTSGMAVAGPLLAPAGLAGLIVVAQPLVLADATAELTVPIVAGLGLAGLALLPGRLSRGVAPGGRVDGFAVACAAGVFAVFAAPFALSGEQTLGGYVELDDTASWLAIADWVIEHGVGVSGLAPSTYEATLDFYLRSEYPVGGLLPLATVGDLLSVDLAWIYQPYLAVLAAMLALSLYAVADRAIESRPLRALAAFVASQAALLFAYALWGGYKELAAAWLVALLAALVAPTLAARAGTRRVLPLAVVAAATLAVLSAGGGVWLLPVLAAALVAAIGTRGHADALRLAGPFAAATLALSIPALLDTGFLGSPAASTVTDQDRLANLIQPLSGLQVLGIWPTGEFRLRPEPLAQTYVLLGVGVVAAALGLRDARRRRSWTLVLYLAAAAAGCVVVVALGSPWVDAKALATASPAFVLIALAGALAVLRTGRRVEAAVLFAAVAGGVLWSNVLAYRDVSLAPHARFEELRSIGERIAGDGPTLMTEYEPYAVRYFLREADPEGASELRRRVVPLRAGGTLAKGESADIDAFDLGTILTYRTLVLRRSPLASRPPSPYRSTWTGRYYDVWQRPPTAGPAVLEHLPLGSPGRPAATPDCGEVLQLARALPDGGRLEAALVPTRTVVGLVSAHAPNGPTDQQTVQLGQSAVTFARPLRLATGGRYGVWLGGSFSGQLELLVDGQRLAARRLELSHDTPLVPLSEAHLDAGRHRIAARYRGADSHPGSGGPSSIGPLILADPASTRPIVVSEPAHARELCGRPFDWIEALGPGGAR